MRKFLVCLIGLVKGLVEFLVFTFVRKIFKVYRSIVAFVSVKMMYSFSWKKIAAKNFFHYKTMFKNIFFILTKGMVRVINMNISMFINNFPTFPRRTIFAFKRFSVKIVVFTSALWVRFSLIPRSKVLFKCLRTTFKRTVFSNIFSVRPYFKRIVTSFTNKLNHFNLQKIKALFRELPKVRYLLSPLLSAFNFRHKKIALSATVFIILLTIGLSSNAYSADQWTPASPAGSDSPSTIDDSIEANNNVVDRLLIGYRQGARIEYLSASTITVTAGEVACPNSGETIVRWRRNTSSTTVSFSDIDTGAENSSTTYYLYAVADTDAVTFTVTISTNASTPSGKTYYARLGSFFNDSDGDISQNDTLTNDNFNISTAYVTSVNLKTATGEVSGTGNKVLPGGEYGFYPQIKGTFSGSNEVEVAISSDQVLGSYTTNIVLRAGSNMFAQQRYITSSGLDHWIFLLADKVTKDIIGAYQAPDHPAYGNGGDFNKLPHPFTNYDSSKHWVIFVEKENTEDLKSEAKEEEISLLTLINDDYKVDYSTVEKYVPIHSGQFLGKEPVLIYDIPEYIKVRKLMLLTNADKVAKDDKEETDRLTKEATRIDKNNKIKSAQDKLKVLGLTDDELEALGIKEEE